MSINESTYVLAIKFMLEIPCQHCDSTKQETKPKAIVEAIVFVEDEQSTSGDINATFPFSGWKGSM
jgi:hypothetical protein